MGAYSLYLLHSNDRCPKRHRVRVRVKDRARPVRTMADGSPCVDTFLRPFQTPTPTTEAATSVTLLNWACEATAGKTDSRSRNFPKMKRTKSTWSGFSGVTTELHPVLQFIQLPE